MSDDSLLFDYMFLNAQEKEADNERLKVENEELVERLNDRKTVISDKEDDIDEARFFAEDVQSIAADC